MDLERYIPEFLSSSNISRTPGQELAISQQPLNANQMMNQSHLVTRYQMNEPQVIPTYQLTENRLYQSRSQVYQNSSGNSSDEPVIVYHVGGSSSEWKKFTVYFLLFVILITVIINSALIIWIISSVNFSPDGIGRIRFPSVKSSSMEEKGKGFKGGESFLHRQLHANHILSPQEKTASLRIISSNGMRIDSKRGDEFPEDTRTSSSSSSNSILDTLNSSGSSMFFMSPSRIGSVVRQLVIKDPDGKLLLMVDESNGVHLAIDRLRWVNNNYGIKLNCSLQVPMLKSLKSSDLRLESLTRNLDLFSPKSVSFSSPLSLHPSSSLSLSLPPQNTQFYSPSLPSFSPSNEFLSPSHSNEFLPTFDSDSNSIESNGKISFQSLNSISFKSKHGSISINSSNIFLDNILTVFPTKRGKTYPGIHGLCSCSETGQLFMIPPEDSCESHQNFCERSKVK